MRLRLAVMLPAAAVTAALLPFVVTGTSHGQDVRTERASVSTGGVEVDAASIQAGMSADGRYVVFASDAADLVANDSGNLDIFVRDRQTGTTERVSIASDGTPAGAPSLFPAISGDGRYVVFQSDATNLVSPDTNATDIFLRDRVTGTTTRVSVASGGAPGNGDSETPSISANGRYVTFTSLADNLAPDDGNQDRDVFVRDLVAGTTELASLATDGTHGNNASGGLGAGPARISNDGRYVVFGSFADTLVANDLNHSDDIFVRDRVAGTTERVSIATDGTERAGHSMYGSISDDGRYVAFFSDAPLLTADDSNSVSDVFLRDRTAGVTTRLSAGPGGAPPDWPSRFPVISADGGVIAFQSDATNLAANDMNGVTDVFLYHMAGGTIERVSVADGGSEGNGASTSPSVSSDGTTVAFQSSAGNLVAGDGNGVTDVFVRGKALGPGPTSTPTPRPPTVTPTPTSAPRGGDVNGDGRVNSIDAAIILQYAAGLLPSPPGGPSSDVNHDGQTNAIDAALILQYSAGLLGQLPP